MYTCALSYVWLLATPRTEACQAPLSTGFPRQEYCSGLPFPTLGDLPTPYIETASLMSPALAGKFLTTGTTWKAAFIVCVKFLFIDSHWKLFFRWSKWLHWILCDLFKIAVQFSSVTHSSPTPCDPMNCSTPAFPVHHQLPEFTQIHVHWVGDAILPSHPLLSHSPPTFNLSQHQGLYKWVSFSHQVAKYWSYSFSISPSNEHSGLIFRMDWLDLLAVCSAWYKNIYHL